MARIYLRSLNEDLYSAANDPQIKTQMIPDLDRKCLRRKTRNGMDFFVSWRFLIFFEKFCLLAR